MARGQQLGNGAAERGPEHMGARIAECCDQRTGIVSQFGETVGRGRIAGVPGIALVIGDHREVRRELSPEGIEHRMIGFGAVQQQQGWSVAAAFEGDRRVVGRYAVHG